MGFTINTNIASLNAQENLRMSGAFQEKTIGRVTSGLRITSSGDDAAGLAIANGYRSDQAVLTQGIRNANDGLSQLQIIDGGLNNISKLLDRARTLATQSASGTFTGSRTVLDNEFQSVLQEIDRQAQSIGLNSGGQFAKSLKVFIGGGQASAGSTAIENGSVGVDLSKSTVDAGSLGLKGFQAKGITGSDIGTGSSTTSVSQILADTSNLSSQKVSGFTEFVFRGAGFSDDQAVKVSVNMSGVTDSATLAEALNSAIASAGNGTTAAATAFKNAGVKASVVTDSDGKQQLAFTSSTAAFQVAAGDRMANALMGNFSAGATGVDLTQSASGSVTAAGTFAAGTGDIVVRFQGAGLSSPVDLTVSITATTTTVDQAIAALADAVANNAELQAAGITTGANFSSGNALSFVSTNGEQLDVSTSGDTTNQLGFGSWMGLPGGFDYLARTGSAAPTAGATDIEFSIAGGAKFSLAVTSSATLADAQTALNAAFASDANARAAGLVATNDGTNLIISSSNDTTFRVNEVGGNLLGFGNAASVASAASASSTLGATASTFNAGGASSSGTLNFSAIRLGNDDQTINISAVDSNGVAQSLNVTLRNDGTSRNATSIDDAIDAINTSLQQSNNSTLKNIVAVKENVGGSETIRFISSLKDFKVSASANATGSTGITTSQGSTVSSSTLAGGATADISSQENAEAAVAALAEAVTALGNSQSSIGRAQNQFNFAVNLASSKLTNIAASESRIRDADLALEAANLTKAQIVMQAGVAALAQANSAPQAVLSLLQG